MKKTKTIRHCDLNLVSYGTCIYVCKYIIAGANSVMLELDLIDFHNIIFKANVIYIL
jgi:hypothetical protein